jgi:L-asparaginase II/GNAT superfamily N-acetyltransferase
MQGGASQGGERRREPLISVAGLDPCNEPLLAVVRGRAVESIHRGAIAVVDIDGELLGGIGDPQMGVLLRSAAKPFQAAAIVESGAAEAFSLSDLEIAVVCASHVGATEHVEVVAALLERAGLSGASLVCGPVEHMCSGKHAGMLLLARHLGVSAEGYEREDHPVQRAVAGYLASLLESCPRRRHHGARAAHSLFAGADGCGVPIIRTTMFEAAWLYASLAAGATPALARVRDAMLAHPALVAGESRFDTRLMRAASGRVVAKGGAEGVQGVGLLSAGTASVVGCVIKVEDGSARPIPPVVALFLRTWELAEPAASVEGHYPLSLVDGDGAEVVRMEVLTESANLLRRRVPARASEQTDDQGDDPYLFDRKRDRVTVCRGDERDVLRFLRDEWPAVDEEYFGRPVEWSAEPYSLVFRRAKKIVAVLKGHFIGGIASVDELMVGHGFRGCGLGALLLGRFEDEARRRQCSRIVLRAVKDTPAEDFYCRRGYHRECVEYGHEFGYDYVRLICDVELTLGEAEGPAWEEKKGAR